MNETAVRRLALPAVLAALALPLLAACGSAGAAADAADAKQGRESGAEVAVAETELGEVLVDAEGKTLYMFKQDEDGESACYEDCEKAWPPLLTEGEPAAGDGAKAELLGTTERTDGGEQVTYKDQPLYYFAKDGEAGDVKGQGAKDVWYTVDADGAAVTEQAGAEGGDSKESHDLALADNAEYGPILVDSEGMTLYMFFKDENLDDASACYGDCLKKWTPLTVESEPTWGEGVDESLVGTIEREDGSTQVTYKDWPMYTFAEDTAAGDTEGVGFKNLWCATTPAGDAAVTK